MPTVMSFDPAQSSPETFRQLAESTADGVAIYDPNARYVWANPALCQRLDLPAHDLVGSTDEDLLGEPGGALTQAIVEAAALRRSARLRCTAPFPDGTRAVDAVVTALDPSTMADHAVAVVTRPVEAADIDRVGWIGAVLDALPVGVSLYRDPAERLYINAAAKQALGVDLALFAGDGQRLAREIDRGAWWEVISRTEERLVHMPDGSERWYRGGNRTVSRTEGRLHVGFVEDVTDRWQSDEARRAGDEHRRALLDMLPIGIEEIDGDGRILYANRARHAMLGEEPGALIGRMVYDTLVAEDQPSFRDRLDAWARLPVPSQPEPVRCRHADGRTIHAELHWAHLRGRSGHRGFIYAAADVSERMATEEKLRSLLQEADTLRAAVDASPSALAIHDASSEAAFIYVNKAFEQMTGYVRDEVIGHGWADLRLGTLAGSSVAALGSLPNAGDTADVPAYRKDGTVFWNRITLAPVFDSRGQIVAHVSLQRDVTREREHDSLTRHRETMESLGRLAGGVAHEINNQLQPVLSMAEFGLSTLDDKETVELAFSTILDAAYRARDVVRGILTFAHRQIPADRPQPLGPIVSDALRMLRRTLPVNLDVVEKMSEPTASAAVNPTELTRLLVNLLTNSADALRGHGRIVVEVERIALSSDEAVPLGLLPASYTRISVTDNGPGMAPETLRRATEPFFTTKPVGEGTGLGLAVVHDIVRSWKGALQIESTLGAGTTVAVFLPQSTPRTGSVQEQTKAAVAD